MHGAGNDYAYFDCFHTTIPNPAETAKKLSQRRFSVGSDGIILILKSKVADAKMRIFNADGSEGKMCGNGIRCVAKYLYDSGKVKRREMTVETLSGVKRLWAYTGEDGKVHSVRADMGKAEFSPKKIPVRLSGEKIVGYPACIGGTNYEITCVSMGNPHCVVFQEAKEPFEAIGRAFEKSSLFPEGVNTEFVTICGKNALKARIWERGSGETFACGTGACASVAAATENGFMQEGKDVSVKLKGGTLIVNYTRERVFMTGEAVTAYIGMAEI